MSKRIMHSKEKFIQVAELIEAMADAEKSGFKRSVKGKGKTTSYLELFKLIDGWLRKHPDGRRDWDLLKQQMKGAAKRQNHTAALDYLLKALLNWLSEAHFKDSELFKSYRQLEVVELLFERKAYGLAGDHVKRGLEAAREFGDPNLCYRWLRWERRLARRNHARKSHFPEIDAEEDSLFKQMANNAELTRLYGDIMARHKSGARPGVEEFQQIMDRLDFLEHQALGFDGELALHGTRGILFHWRSNPAGTQSAYEACFLLWNRFEAQIRVAQRRYIAAVFNFLHTCLLNDDFVTYEKYRGHVQQELKLGPSQETELQAKLLYLEIFKHLRSKDYANAYRTVARNQDQLKDVFYYLVSAPNNIATAYFLGAPASEARKQLGQLLGGKRGSLRTDIERAIRLMLAFLWLEDDPEMLQKEYRSLKRRYGQDSERWIVQVLNFLKQWIKVFGTPKRLVLVDQLRAQLKASEADELGREELLIWLSQAFP